MQRARAAALELARCIGVEVGLPVCLYGEIGAGRGPAFFRSGGTEELQQRIDAGELLPDFGPSRLDPAAGGVIVGARRPLIAFNVNLVGANVEAAREIAAVVRERDGGFPGVRALGLDLPSTGQAQVSMNVEDWEASALHEIVATIEHEAAARGVEVAGAELVGLMPAGAAAAAAGATLRIDGVDAGAVPQAGAMRRDCSSCGCSRLDAWPTSRTSSRMCRRAASMRYVSGRSSSTGSSPRAQSRMRRG